MTKILLMGTSYIGNHSRRDLVALWAKVVRHLNPKTDIALVDSASPVDVYKTTNCEENRIRIFQFPDNIGNLNTTQKDGWGRAFCKGVELAIEGGYDYMAHIDSDLLFSRPVTPIVEKLKAHDVKVATPLAFPYLFAETACLFASVPYLRDMEFVKKYDWPTSPVQPIPETRCEKLFADELFGLPFKGIRNDGGFVNWQNFDDRAARYGLDFFTHNADFGLYHKFLKLNGIEL